MSCWHDLSICEYEAPEPAPADADRRAEMYSWLTFVNIVVLTVHLRLMPYKQQRDN